MSYMSVDDSVLSCAFSSISFTASVHRGITMGLLLEAAEQRMIKAELTLCGKLRDTVFESI